MVFPIHTPLYPHFNISYTHPPPHISPLNFAALFAPLGVIYSSNGLTACTPYLTLKYAGSVYALDEPDAYHEVPPPPPHPNNG